MGSCFTSVKWFIGYNLGKEGRTESKFGTNKQLIVRILNKCSDETILLKILIINKFGDRFKKRNQVITFLSFIWKISNWTVCPLLFNKKLREQTQVF